MCPNTASGTHRVVVVRNDFKLMPDRGKHGFLKIDNARENFQNIYSIIYKMTILVSMRLSSTSAVESVSWSTKLYWT